MAIEICTSCNFFDRVIAASLSPCLAVAQYDWGCHSGASRRAEIDAAVDGQGRAIRRLQPHGSSGVRPCDRTDRDVVGQIDSFIAAAAAGEDRIVRIGIVPCGIACAIVPVCGRGIPSMKSIGGGPLASVLVSWLTPLAVALLFEPSK